MNEGVSVQACACHSGNLHDTVGKDLPELKQIDRNLQENYDHFTRTVLFLWQLVKLSGLIKGRVVKKNLNDVCHKKMNESLALPSPTYGVFTIPYCLSTVPLFL